ncbi:MAG: lipopolysaccharide heptosyltransferase II [Candidatus Binatia bacterium]
MKRSNCSFSLRFLASRPKVPIRDLGRGEKILVVQTSFLGDTVLSTPLFAAIRDRFPESHLTVLSTPQGKSLLVENPNIDEIITDDKKGEGRGLFGLWRKAEDLKHRAFTIAITPHKSLRTALLLCLARIPCRIGFRQSAGWFLYHCRVDRDSVRHDVDRNLSILKAFGINPDTCAHKLQVPVHPRTRETVEQLFNSLGITRNGITVGLNPGAVWATKRWTAVGYSELMIELKQRYGYQIVLFGGPEDLGIIAEIQRLAGHVGISLAGKIDLCDLAAAIERCDLFITNDSGPMHVAVACGVPVLAVFCATTPSLGFYPYSSKAVVVEKALACRPCSSHGGRRCPLGTEDCMRLIKPKDLLNGVEQLLHGKPQVGLSGSDVCFPQFITC